MRKILILLSATLAVCLAPGAAWAAPHGAGEPRAGAVAVPVTADAWYTVSPTCPTPIGCSAVPFPTLASYPAGTLHVGLSGGFEDSRTYLRLDLSAVPQGAALTGGTVVIPIAPEADGTQDAQSALLRICLVLEDFDPESEGAADPPPIDCTLSSNAIYDAEPAPRFLVDLAPVATLMASARGVAIVVREESMANWHVAMSSSERPADDAAVPGPSARVEYLLPAVPPVAAEPAADGLNPSLDDMASGEALESFGATEPLVGGLEPQAVSAPPPVAAAPAPPQVRLERAVAPVARPVALPRPPVGSVYPAIFLLPIALAVGGMYLGRAFTRPLTLST